LHNLREVKDRRCLEVIIYVKPRAKITSLKAEGGELIFLTREPPLGSRANESLIKYLSRLLNLRKGDIEIIRGTKNRVKVLRICGISSNDFSDKVYRSP